MGEATYPFGRVPLRSADPYPVYMARTDSSRQAVRIDEVSLGVTIVDVTQWDGPVDDRLLGRPDAVFVCFGSHDSGVCALPLNGALPDPHGVVLAAQPSVESHDRLARRYRQLVRSEIPVTVFDPEAQAVRPVETA